MSFGQLHMRIWINVLVIMHHPNPFHPYTWFDTLTPPTPCHHRGNGAFKYHSTRQNTWNLFPCIIGWLLVDFRGVGQCPCTKWCVKARWRLVKACNSHIRKVPRVTGVSVASSPPIASKHWDCCRLGKICHKQSISVSYLWEFQGRMLRNWDFLAKKVRAWFIALQVCWIDPQA